MPGARAVEAVEPQVWRMSFDGDPVEARRVLEQLPADIFVRPVDAPAPRLLVADMDSTMITVECIDELADYAGVKPQVAQITEAAMRGELDFAGSLRARVKLLAGLDTAVLGRCHDERVRIMPGATTLVRTLRARGVRTLLVSGGFTVFAERVAQAIGFDEGRANILGVSAGTLDGTVADPVLGAEAKRAELLDQGIDPAAVVAIGDGANDIPMLQAAGFGIAYHGKPAVVAAADAAVRFGDLTAVLHGLGVPRGEWVTSLPLP
ncbi:phosphoserine phosphatase [Sphingomonas changbaiensis NBRC 104936]|uniref:Phosphoserine phosphatase n=1 Tax=Sphingomonas changbaiensis NBRC 104936 TaxID=1219043 RepID=A0A0E9MSP4_9SPHN|nr:phosphoserine phosphatase SerB [Sphingomonas changbaiensis]GAO40807.1 phosphoserine phosphatase [Sphingomonas changbaiensis NBRC 104936]